MQRFLLSVSPLYTERCVVWVLGQGCHTSWKTWNLIVSFSSQGKVRQFSFKSWNFLRDNGKNSVTAWCPIFQDFPTLVLSSILGVYKALHARAGLMCSNAASSASNEMGQGSIWTVKLVCKLQVFKEARWTVQVGLIGVAGVLWGKGFPSATMWSSIAARRAPLGGWRKQFLIKNSYGSLCYFVNKFKHFYL